MEKGSFLFILFTTLTFYEVVSVTTTSNPLITTPVEFLLPGNSVRSRSGFGEQCNKTKRCKSNSWLTCDQETYQCSCSRPDEMIYDPLKEKCVALIGERCKFNFEEASDDSSVKLYETVECVSGAECDVTNGLCTCPRGTFEFVEDNKCVPVIEYGGNCSAAVECDLTRFQNCINGTCQCLNPKGMTYLENETECRVKPGHGCKFPNVKEYKPKCFQEESTCDDFDGICNCNEGTYLDEVSGYCLPVKHHGEFCNSSKECNNKLTLVCISNMCDCDPSKAIFTPTSYYSYNFGRSYGFNVPAGICVGRVGAVCTVPTYNNHYGYNPYQTIQTYCLEKGFCNESGICTCKNGYSTTSEKLCGLTYNKECSEIDFCSDEFSCIPSSDNKCGCRKGTRFEDYTCKLEIGSRCDPKGIMGCVKNSLCKEVEGVSDAHVCECAPGFIDNESGTCDIDYRAICTNSFPVIKCDKKAGLECILDGSKFRCICPKPFQVYEEDLRKCSAPIGTKCTRNFDDNDCIEGATCVVKPKLTYGRCMCKPGMKYMKGQCVTIAAGV